MIDLEYMNIEPRNAYILAAPAPNVAWDNSTYMVVDVQKGVGYETGDRIIVSASGNARLSDGAGNTVAYLISHASVMGLLRTKSE